MTAKIVEEHYQATTITEYEHIPDHEERKETQWFRSAKKELESVEHLGCYICGSTVKPESHHIFERCWGNVFDYKKVAYMLFNHYDYHGHCHRDFKEHSELLKWFMTHFKGKEEEVLDEEGIKHTIVTCDDDALDTIYNQLILDESHHRTIGHSAHGSTFATMTALTAARPDFHVSLSTEEYQEILKQHHEEKHGK
jgi:hypothetical protein